MFHDLHLPRPDCHMQGGAQQLGGRKQKMLAEGTWALVPLRVEGLSIPAFLPPPPLTASSISK